MDKLQEWVLQIKTKKQFVKIHGQTARVSSSDQNKEKVCKKYIDKLQEWVLQIKTKKKFVKIHGQTARVSSSDQNKEKVCKNTWTNCKSELFRSKQRKSL